MHTNMPILKKEDKLKTNLNRLPRWGGGYYIGGDRVGNETCLNAPYFVVLILESCKCFYNNITKQM